MQTPRILSIPETIFYDERLSPRELKIWVEVYQFHGAKFFASASWIAKKVNLDIKTVYRAISNLVKYELLESYVYNGKRHLIALVPEEGELDLEGDQNVQEGDQMITKECPNDHFEGDQMITSLIYKNINKKDNRKSLSKSFKNTKEKTQDYQEATKLLPPQLKTQECFMALNDFFESLRENGRPITCLAFKKIIAKVITWTPEQFCEACDSAVVGGWVNLFLPKPKQQQAIQAQTRPVPQEYKPAWQNEKKADPEVAKKHFDALRAKLSARGGANV